MEKVDITFEQLQRIKRIQLDILKEVDKICDKYKINYCIGYGTLLGAVRHQGYIPWDDDADILMLRNDYNKFKEVCKRELSEKYYFQDNETDPEYLWGYAKIRNTNTTFIRYEQEHINYKGGIFIDIFPLDNIPNSLILQFIQDAVCGLLRKALWARVGKIHEKNSYIKLIYKVLDKIPKRTIYAIVNKMINCSPKESEYVRCLLFTAPGKHWNNGGKKSSSKYGFKREWLKDRKKYMFENLELWGSKDYDKCLKYLYGDYMKLPPNPQRVGHAPVSALDLKYEGIIENMDKIYWNKFYSLDKVENTPSRFALFVETYLEKGKKIADLGCGNGRDSIYFGSKGMDVVSIDISEVAIQNLSKTEEGKVSVVNQSFVDYLSKSNNEFDYLYSRFSIHAISKEEQDRLFKYSYQSIKSGGKFFIEVRCKKDDLYGYGKKINTDTFFYNEHTRRFVDKNEIENDLKREGFLINYSKQSRGFAPYQDEDPIILRIIGSKEENE